MALDLDIRPPSSPNLALAFDAAVKRAFRGYSVEMSTPAPSAGSGVQTLRHYLRFLGLAKACLQERGLTVSVVAYSKSVTTLDEHPTPRPRRATIPHFGFVAAASLTAIASVAGELLGA